MTIPPNSFHPQSRSQWRTWLENNHETSTGVWLINYKKDTQKPRLDYEEMVEEALCFGWIDSVQRKVDEERSMLWMCPRKKGSKWSALNKHRVKELIANGLMMKAGLDKIELAKKNGTWTALDRVEQLIIPDGLKKALKKYPPAAENFNNFPRSVKRAILEWILNAKKPETQNKRIEETATLAQKNIRANQWKQEN